MGVRRKRRTGSGGRTNPGVVIVVGIVAEGKQMSASGTLPAHFGRARHPTPGSVGSAGQAGRAGAGQNGISEAFRAGQNTSRQAQTGEHQESNAMMKGPKQRREPRGTDDITAANVQCAGPANRGCRTLLTRI